MEERSYDIELALFAPGALGNVKRQRATVRARVGLEPGEGVTTLGITIHSEHLNGAERAGVYEALRRAETKRQKDAGLSPPCVRCMGEKTLERLVENGTRPETCSACAGTGREP